MYWFLIFKTTHFYGKIVERFLDIPSKDINILQDIFNSGCSDSLAPLPADNQNELLM